MNSEPDRAAGLSLNSSCRRSQPGPAAGPSRKGFAMASTLSTSEATGLAPATRGLKEQRKKRPGPYPYWFYVAPRDHLLRSSSSFLRSPPSTSPSPGGTCSPRPGSAWRTTRPSSPEQALIIGLRNTLIYAVITSGLKVVLGMALAAAADLARSSHAVTCGRSSSSRCWSAPSASVSPSPS